MFSAIRVDIFRFPRPCPSNSGFMPYEIVHLESAQEMDSASYAMGFNVTFSQSRAGDAVHRCGLLSSGCSGTPSECAQNYDIPILDNAGTMTSTINMA